MSNNTEGISMLVSVREINILSNIVIWASLIYMIHIMEQGHTSKPTVAAVEGENKAPF